MAKTKCVVIPMKYPLKTYQPVSLKTLMFFRLMIKGITHLDAGSIQKHQDAFTCEAGSDSAVLSLWRYQIQVLQLHDGVVNVLIFHITQVLGCIGNIISRYLQILVLVM